MPPHLTASAARFARAVPALGRDALRRMDEQLPWYAAMPPAERVGIGNVVEAGLRTFAVWIAEPVELPPTSSVFGIAPRDLARAITLHQTVEMVRLVVGVVEEQVRDLAAVGEADALAETLLRFSREVAFAAAEVYARAAEERGGWDARLETLLAEALLRPEPPAGILLRATSLGWGSVPCIAVVAGHPRGEPDTTRAIRHLGRRAGLPVLAEVVPDVVLALLGGPPERLAQTLPDLYDTFGPGPLVLGGYGADLAATGPVARAALAALRAAPAWPDAPRPVAASALLVERVLGGDPLARLDLLAVHARLDQAPAVRETLGRYFACNRSVEATARDGFLHPNTVRNRLAKVTDLTGLSPHLPRDSWTLQVSLVVGILPTAP